MFAHVGAGGPHAMGRWEMELNWAADAGVGGDPSTNLPSVCFHLKASTLEVGTCVQLNQIIW